MGSQGKGVWSQVVRGVETSSGYSVQEIDGSGKITPVVSGPIADSEAESTDNIIVNTVAPLTPTSPSLSNAKGTKPREGVQVSSTLTKNDQRNILEMIASESDVGVPAEGFSTASKPVWRKPSKPSTKLPDGGAVMGAVAWPALADARPTKPSDLPRSAAPHIPNAGNSEQAAVAAVPGWQKAGSHTGHGNADSGPRHKEASKQVGIGVNDTPLPSAPRVVSDMTAVGSLQNTSLQEATPIDPRMGSSGESSSKPSSTSSAHNDRGWMPHPRGNNAGFNGGNRRIPREQGRGGHNWHPQRPFNYGRDNVAPIHVHQHRVGPRSFSPNVANFVNTNAGYINAPGPGAMFYVPTAGPGHVQGAGYFAPSGAPGVIFPMPDNNSVSVQALLVKQIEYYFSVENLCRDIFLRSKMDEQGFIPVSVIASFNRVRMWTDDRNMILNALCNSKVVEVQGDKLRKRGDWSLWLLPSNLYNASSIAGSGSINKKVEGLTSGDYRASDSKALPREKAQDANLRDTLNVNRPPQSHVTQTSMSSLEAAGHLQSRDIQSHDIGAAELHIASEYAKGSIMSQALKQVDVGTDNSTNLHVDRREIKVKGFVDERRNNLTHELANGTRSDSNAGKLSASITTQESSSSSVEALASTAIGCTSNEEDTFQMDEELESNRCTKELGSVFKSREEDLDDSDVNDSDLQHLFIVTQSRRTNRGDRKGSDGFEQYRNGISEELATVINDGLYFYEQELHLSRGKRSSGAQLVWERKQVHAEHFSSEAVASQASAGKQFRSIQHYS
ncbi:hypothetical protein O6H91_Y077000 [Diphasiastrum complanatum]|nr:hypothetical protein O6H91_Y077000 [Diphasiastrum complanatum]KAJ7297146.1 hypothetical protein O6H91_Y077000 [Diphasiastrum complanatum]